MPELKPPSGAATLPSHNLRLHLPIWLLTVLLLGAIWFHVFSQIEEDRTHTLAAADNDLVNLGRVSQEHAERTFSSADQTLRMVVAQYQRDGKRIDLKQMAEQGLIDTRIVLQVSVINANGFLERSSLPFEGPIDLSEREHFKVHLAAGKDALFISRPVLGRASGKWSIQLSRRISGKDGAFGGVVVAALDPNYFSGFYSELSLGEQGVATLFGLDGGIRARRAGAKEQFTGDLSGSPVFLRLAKNEQTGTHTSRSVVDGVERMLHFRTLPSYPLGVLIGLSTNEVLANHAPSRSSLMLQAAIASGFLLVIAVLASWYALSRQRHAQAQDKVLQLLQNLTSRVPGLIYQYRLRADGSSCFPFASEAIHEIYRLRAEDVLTNSAKVNAVLHPDDASLVQASIQKSAQELMPWSQEYRVRFDDGTERWLFGSALPQREADGATLWHGFIADITERKQIEAKLAHESGKSALLLRNASDGIHILDRQGNVVESSDSFCQMLGYTRAEVIGMHVSRWEAQLTAGEIEIALERQLNEPELTTFETRHRCKDGSVFEVEVTGRVLILEGQQVLFNSSRQITKRKYFEAALLRSNRELEQFSYAISHDLRQPLRMIASYLKLLDTSLAGRLDGDNAVYFHFAIDGAQRLDRMLVGLLEYSRIGSKGEPSVWIESRAVLDQALSFLQPAIAEAQANIHIEGDWPRVLASPDEILRLLQNLIGNAIKFRVAGRTPEIRVASSISAPAGKTLVHLAEAGLWRVSVSDNGIGIHPGQAGRLFQVFQRLQSRTAFEGSGIGLALCRKIAEHHGGSISLASPGEGLGSSFVFSMPLQRGGTP